MFLCYFIILRFHTPSVDALGSTVHWSQLTVHGVIVIKAHSQVWSSLPLRDQQEIVQHQPLNHPFQLRRGESKVSIKV
jgi:hypothetical protein